MCSKKMAVPGFSFFDLGLDALFQRDENGLVDIKAVAEDYLLAWNDGDDGPVVAGPSGWPVFSVVETRRVFGRATRQVSASDFVVYGTVSGDTIAAYGTVKWRLHDDGTPVITSGWPNWTSEQWKAMTRIAEFLLSGKRFITA